MSEAQVASNRFWNQFKPDILGTLSTEQRHEIDRALDASAPAPSKEVSDLRLSFKWFFVRIAWGPEKRSPERVKKEQEMFPALSRRNAPLLVSLFAGYALFWYMLAALVTLITVFYIL